VSHQIPKLVPRFHKTLRNPTVPGGEVDMWEMATENGETILSVAVATGCDKTKTLPEFIARACNEHDALVEFARVGLAALEEDLELILESHCELNDDLSPRRETLEEEMIDEVADLEAKIVKGRAALAKATGAP
jgi:hydroxyethylthiazole kinase-like sugar kinase family protein